MGRYPNEVPDILFLTTETIWGRLSKRDLSPIRSEVLELLRVMIRTFHQHQVRVILHLRRIDLYLESLYKQEVKAGRPTSMQWLIDRITAERAWHFLQLLEEVFGRENVIVRPFERSQLYEGDAVADLLRDLGLLHIRDQLEVVHGNEGLHRDLVETLLVLNRDYGKIVPNNHLLRISERLHTEYGLPDEKHLLDRATRERLLADYRDFYDYLGRTYGDGGPFFRDAVPDDTHMGYELPRERFAFIRDLVLAEAGGWIEPRRCRKEMEPEWMRGRRRRHGDCHDGYCAEAQRFVAGVTEVLGRLCVGLSWEVLPERSENPRGSSRTPAFEQRWYIAN